MKNRLPLLHLTLLLLGLVIFFGGMACIAAETPMLFPPQVGRAVEDANNHAPKVVQSVEAVYPVELKNRTMAAEVYVAFVVDQAGKVRNPRALFGRFPEFEKAAVDAVAQWQFTPGMHEGHEVGTQMIVLVTFSAEPKT